MKGLVMGAAAVILAVITLPAVASETAALPKGYERWEMSREKIINDKSSLFYGIHRIYVNDRALKAYRSGGRYPEGSQFVVVQHTIRNDGAKPVKGKKSMVVLMCKDKRHKDTGGWLFAGFTPEGKPSGLDPVKNCFECHARDAAARDFVISRYADFR